LPDIIIIYYNLDDVRNILADRVFYSQ